MERKISITNSVGQFSGMKSWLIDAKTVISLAVVAVFIVIIVGIGSLVQHQAMELTEYRNIASADQISLPYLSEMMAKELPLYNNPFSISKFSLREIGSVVLKGVTDLDISALDQNILAEMPYAKRYINEIQSEGVRSHQVLIEETLGKEDLTHLIDELNHLNETLEQKVISTNENEQNENKEVVAATKKVAFVYHTHNRESWFPEVGENTRDASSKTKNITLVGKRLAEELNKLNVGTVVSDTDYSTEINDYRWEYSYKYSKKTIGEAKASYEDLEMFFDIHRDSQPRKYTTVEIDGQSYAQVYFVIGHRNPNWKKNDAFARRINDRLKEKYPGLSRGILGKTAASGNAEYNQSLSEKNILIEVGGVDNTLEESYRTAKALAEVIAEIYAEDQQSS